eukprot:m.25954 g.25954  ORF g.25954 m.25954 type:complete len:615 (-) comp11649_c0_seq1:919-2763(-)
MASGGFAHDAPAFEPQSTAAAEFHPSAVASVGAPAFQPSSSTSSFHASSASVPAFTPTAKATTNIPTSQAPAFQPSQPAGMTGYQSSPQLPTMAPEASSFHPTGADVYSMPNHGYSGHAAMHQMPMHSSGTGHGSAAGFPGMGMQDPSQAMGGIVIPEVAHTTQPFQPPGEPVTYMYSMGKLEQPFVASKQPRLNRSYFMDRELKRELLSRRVAAESQMADPSLPVEVDNFHTLVPLELLADPSRTFGTQTLNYKAFSMETNLPCLLRRVVNYRLSDPQAMRRVEPWRKLRHPGIVHVKEAFTTKDFGDHSLVLMYELHPNVMTLRQKHLSQLGSSTVPENLLWNYIIQLASALRTAHSANLAIRAVNPDKIIVMSRSKLMFSAPCIMEMLYFEDDQRYAQAIGQHQQEDLAALGQVFLSLACSCLPVKPQDNIQQALAYIASNYSKDFLNVVQYLISPPSFRGQVKSVNDLMPLIGARFFTHMDQQADHTEVLESNLSKECYNGHLFRLISKLSTVVDRPPPAGQSAHWHESGDAYMLRLFQHYVFHQSRGAGRGPFIDMGHIVQTFAKLDAKSPETICLMTPDAKNVMVVTFEEVAKALDKSFTELLKQEET